MSFLVKATTNALSRAKNDAATAKKPQHRALGVSQVFVKRDKQKKLSEMGGKKKQKEAENKIDKLIS